MAGVEDTDSNWGFYGDSHDDEDADETEPIRDPRTTSPSCRLGSTVSQSKPMKVGSCFFRLLGWISFLLFDGCFTLLSVGRSRLKFCW